MTSVSGMAGGTGSTGAKVDSSGSLLTAELPLSANNNTSSKKSVIEHP